MLKTFKNEMAKLSREELSQQAELVIRASFFFFLAFALMIFIKFEEARANDERLICHTPNNERTFIIDDNKVSLLRDHVLPDFRAERSISSVSKVRTQKSGKSVTKAMHFEGHSYRIHVENVSIPSELDDYVSIRSNRGHEMTYPLHCQKSK